MFNHQGNYTCVCGKEFNNSQSFNGHKSMCKLHQQQKYGSLELFINSNNRRIFTCESNKRLIESEKQQIKNKQLEQWVSEQHKCEHCGKIMTEKYGSGRFCCRSCANSRKHSNETKQKISTSLKQERLINVTYCKLCGKQLGNRNKTGYCIQCINTSPALYELRKSRAVNASKHIKHHATWLSRDKTSYPERFWIEVLENNNIKFEHNKPIKQSNGKTNYFLDFYIETSKNKIDLEIDGKQHNYTVRKEHDDKRDTYLKSIGYLVYRIKWNSINSEEGKLEMQNKINDFLMFLHDN